MHRYREFGLVSDEDETFRRAFRDGFRRAGLPFARFVEALEWYRDHAGAGAAEDELVEAFAEYATDRGWSPRERDGALDAYRVIRDKGPQAVMSEAPVADEDRATIARSDDLLRRDPARYWGDIELQDAVFEARERLGNMAEVAQPARSVIEANTDRQRVAKIEAMLHDPSGAGQRRYWNDAALRNDYAQALARIAGGERQHDGAAPASPGATEIAAVRGTPLAVTTDTPPSDTALRSMPMTEVVPAS
jgi:hypothetical protein